MNEIPKVNVVDSSQMNKLCDERVRSDTYHYDFPSYLRYRLSCFPSKIHHRDLNVVLIHFEANSLCLFRLVV